MDIKKFWKVSLGGFILKNLLIVIGVIVVLAWIALIGVDFYTHHGDSETVPDLRGSYVEEAELLLGNQGLHVQVIDSVYVRDKKLGTIIDQNPAPNSTVKTNRTIYITINSRRVREVTLPDVSDVSSRQAVAMLQSIGLSVGSIEEAPSEYKDLVIEVKYKGRTIIPGVTRVPEGSAVVLIVGSGQGAAPAEVPDLKGMGLDEATEELTSATFTLGAVEYDVPPSGNEDEYIIYRQRPAGLSSVPTGTRIDVFLTKDKARMKEKFEEPKKTDEPDEVFF